MKFSDRIFYRKMYFSFVTKEKAQRGAVYSVLLKGTQNVLIDCGVSYNLPDIEMLCQEAGISIQDLSCVIHTHCHADHTGLCATLQQRNPRLRVAAHPLCKVMIESPEEQFRVRPVPFFHFLMSGTVTVHQILEHEQMLDLPGFPVQVLYTPGHSGDSISLYLPEEQLLIAGDSIPNMQGMPFYEDTEASFRTLTMLEALPVRYVISAFTGLWDMEKQGNMFSAAKTRLADIQAEIAKALQEDPDATLPAIGKRVLRMLNISAVPSPLFLSGLSSGISLLKKSDSKQGPASLS